MTQQGFDAGHSCARGGVAGAKSGAESNGALASSESDEAAERGGEFGSVSEVDGTSVGFVFGLVANEVPDGVGGVEHGEEHPGDTGEESGDHSAEGGEGSGVLHETFGGGAGDVLEEEADAGEGDDRQ